MKTFDKITKIAGLNQEVQLLIKELASESELDTESMDLTAARFVSGCTEENGHLMQNGRQLDNCGLANDTHYIYQQTVTGEDDSYGILYFKTGIIGNFVAVPFQA